jgi:uncharacterized membrane protein
MSDAGVSVRALCTCAIISSVFAGTLLHFVFLICFEQHLHAFLQFWLLWFAYNLMCEVWWMVCRSKQSTKAMNMDQWTAFLRFCEEVEVLSAPPPASIASFNRDTMLCFGM